jgi:peroxiredoxin
MKLRTSLAGLAALGLLLFGAAAGSETTGQQMAETAGRGLVGSPAPRLILKTVDGETIDIGGLYGKKALYIKFWATWCVPCREQMPHFQHVYETAGSDLAVIAVNAGFNDSVEEIRKYRKQFGITMPIVFDDDGRVGAAFNLRVTPQHIVIGRDGRIQYVGHLADARLDTALQVARAPGLEKMPFGAGGENRSAAARHFAVGDWMPDASTKTLDGKSFQFRPHGPKSMTVLVFLSPWCESYLATTRPAISTNCRITREQVAALSHDPRVRWLGVASGLWATPEDLQEYQTKYKVDIPLTLDQSGSLFREFAVNNTPTIIVSDATGKIVHRVGPDEARTLQQVLQ